ncbi:hypothetical protein [Planobispora longispora]|uniref:Uncharacterized protein n=1 Tax=Planobispora longispora TaxID=28887 RepID=A0A8J3W9B1_9ACTN|nr:hypothetical protein [Planobispora longispora]GIH81544.1 hypothetical protein Plo01_79730 [Planobispora longispora]
MRRFVELLGLLLIVQGVGTVVNALLGWWRWAHDLLLVNHLGFLEGWEALAGIVLGVLGVTLRAAARTGRAPR